MIASGILLAYVAIRPSGFGHTSLSLFTHNFAFYSLVVTAVLLVLIWPFSYNGELMAINPLTTLIQIIVVVSGAVFTFLMRRGGAEKILELSVLVLFGILGMILIISANDLLMLYLGLELQSLTFFILAAIKRNGEFSTEAGLKYFILGAVSSGLFLLGCAYTYLVTGHTGYSALSELSLAGLSSTFGAILILIALLWKVGAGPLHMWVPDVYEGSPSIITALFAIVPKISIIGVIIRLITGPFIGVLSDIQSLLILSAILSLLAGCIGALNQSKLKRVLAYSAISHTGFLLAGISAGSIEGLIATLIYNVLYIFMSFNTFTIIVSLFPSSANYSSMIAGLSRHNLILALTLAIALLSLAGIPPLAGFISKYWVLIATFKSNLYFLTGVAITASVISAFFYLQLVKIMFFKDTGSYNWKIMADWSSGYWVTIGKPASLILGGSLFVILTALIYPQPIIAMATDAIVGTLA
jgi:NADH-quinone oxidoreductase subunit N